MVRQCETGTARVIRRLKNEKKIYSFYTTNLLNRNITEKGKVKSERKRKPTEEWKSQTKPRLAEITEKKQALNNVAFCNWLNKKELKYRLEQ